MKITVIGLGYVGLANALVLSRKHNVIGYDIDNDKIDKLSKRIEIFKEKEINEYLNDSSLHFYLSKDKENSIKDSDLIIIAVPTNFSRAIHSFDTSIVEETIKEILRLHKDADILIKSTVPVGFSKMMKERYNAPNIYFSPEFLREGHAINDALDPSRIIVGYTSNDEEHIERAKLIGDLYLSNLKRTYCPLSIIPSSDAEAVKLFSNSYLAMRVAFFNELDSFAETKGLSTKNIIDNVCLDPRIGDGYNNPSFGYGGYCLPKDTKELKHTYDIVPETLISAIIDSNKVRKQYIVDSIIKKIDGKGVIGVYHLAMKKGSDNFRQSSVIDVIKLLRNKGFDIVIYEPSIETSSFNGIRIINDFDAFVKISKIIIANRIDDKIISCDKLYSRDLYKKD